MQDAGIRQRLRQSSNLFYILCTIMSVMSDLGSALDKAASMSNNLVFRDKSIKVLQYASRVLLGCYGDSLHAATKASTTSFMFQCGQARKAFRLLKSVNMLNTLVVRGVGGLLSPLRHGSEGQEEHTEDKSPDMVAQNQEIMKFRKLAQHFETLELACMTGYYLCDNMVFLGRANVLPWLPQSSQARFWETITFSFWAVNDLTSIFRHCLLLRALWLEEQALLHPPPPPAAGGGDADAKKSATVDTDTPRSRASHEVNASSAVRTRRKDLLWSLTKSVLDLGVSGGHCMYMYRDSAVVRGINDYTPLYRAFGNNAPLNPNIGICGVLSSLMILYEQLSGVGRSG